MNPEAIQWDNTEAKKYLDERGGSKAGTHAFLHDKHPKLRQYLPEGAYLAPGEDPEKFLAKMDDRKVKIIRGCHPGDVFGMVDVIRTVLGVRGKDKIRDAIQEVLESGQDPEVSSFAEYESGKPFDGKVGIFVQDYCGSDRGSIVEHPHEKGIYVIGERFRTQTSSTEVVQEGLYDARGCELQATNMLSREDSKEYNENAWDREEKEELIHVYRQVQDTGLMPSTHSFQMEYGRDQRKDLKIYQARLFRPYEPMANFDVMDLRKRGILISQAYATFGVTSPEGTDMIHRGELTQAFVEKLSSEKEAAYAHNNHGHRQSTALTVQPRNMDVYLPYQGHFLEHGHFRWVQKAPVSLIGMGYMKKRVAGQPDNPYAHFVGRPVQEINQEMRLRVFSDGFRGLIQFE